MKKNQLMKHVKRTVSQFESRPILQCANYSNDGNLYATDSHVALKVSEFHSNVSEFNLNVFTLELNDGTYPDIAKLFLMEKIGCEIKVHVGTLLKSIRPFVNRLDFRNTIRMDIKDKSIVLTKSGWSNYRIEMPLEDCEGEMSISVDVENLVKALEFMSDAINEKKFNKNGANDGCAIVKFSPTNTNPFILQFEKYEYLVAPVRTDF